MVLKNVMDDKQLNFSQPLLSVRKYATTATSRRTYGRKIACSRPVIPQLPPQRPEQKSGPVSNPGAVPFVWEQSPGQPKEEIKRQPQNFDSPPVAPKLPPGRCPATNQQDCRKVSQSKRAVVDVSFDSHSEPTCDENVKDLGETREESSVSGDSDEAYVDALDTLSRAESFFINCSMSGVSGLDDLDVKPLGNFSTDRQAREFMMDRFLPAAKAMASETPQSAPKKQLVVREQRQQVKKVVTRNKPSLRYGPSFAKRYSHYHDEEENESDDEYDRRQNLPGVCGLLPRFCLKSSLSLLNPVPAMSVRTRGPMSYPNKVQPRTLSTSSYSETENESRSDRTAKLDADKTTSRNGRQVIATHEEKGFGLHENGLKTFQELLADEGSPNESDSGGPVIEKTLYVDTVQKMEPPNLMSFSCNTQDAKVVPSTREEHHEIITKRMDQKHAIDSSLEDFNNSIDGEDNLLPNEPPKAVGENKGFNRALTATENIEVTEKEAKGSLEEHLSRAITFETSLQDDSQLPPPPPLPKSPSDSWLWRTLPSVSSKNPTLRSYLSAATNPQKNVSKALAPTSDVKWETIVKTTKVQHRHLHYSEDVLNTIPEV